MKRIIRLDGEKSSEKGLRFLEFILSVIKGQDKAVKDLADAIEVFESEIFTENKPIYVGLCCGPSGVGKTLTAELLAEYWFGNRKAFTIINCAEFSESHRVSELKGSPAGYIGHWNPKNPCDSGTPPILWQGNIDRFASAEDPELFEARNNLHVVVERAGELNYELAEQMADISELFDNKGEIGIGRLPELIRKIKESFPIVAEREKIMAEVNKLAAIQAFTPIKKLKSIILFDEIEKAHPDMHKLLLGIMDKAEFRLANGLVTDFSNSVILLTSNVGSHKIAGILNPKGKIGFAEKVEKKDNDVLDREIYKQTLEELKQVFSPEFLARLDRISVYRPLSQEVLKNIVDVEFRMFQKKILKNFPITLCFDEKVKEFILNESTDKPEKGARLVKNKVYKYLRKPICRLKNNGDIKAGDTIHILLEEKEGKSYIVFGKEEEKKEDEKKD